MFQGSSDVFGVGMGNIWERDFELPDGGNERSLSCKLFPADDESLVVRVGTEVTIGGAQYKVVAIDENPPDTLGHVVLRPQG